MRLLVFLPVPVPVGMVPIGSPWGRARVCLLERARPYAACHRGMSDGASERQCKLRYSKESVDAPGSWLRSCMAWHDLPVAWVGQRGHVPVPSLPLTRAAARTPTRTHAAAQSSRRCGRPHAHALHPSMHHPCSSAPLVTSPRLSSPPLPASSVPVRACRPATVAQAACTPLPVQGQAGGQDKRKVRYGCTGRCPRRHCYAKDDWRMGTSLSV